MSIVIGRRPGVHLSGGMAIGTGAGVQLSGGGGCTAHDRIVGAVSNGATFTHPANGVIALTATALGSTSSNLRFRILDANNYWRVAWDNTGAYSLLEYVAGAPTTRASAAGVVSAGHRIVIAFNGTTITGYSGGVQRWTYASAANYATRTDGVQFFAGTSGVISDLSTWAFACLAHALSIPA